MIFLSAEGYGFNRDGSVIAGSCPQSSLPAGTPVHPRIIARCYDENGHPTREGEANRPTIVIPERDEGAGGGAGGGGEGGGSNDPNSPPLPPRCPLYSLAETVAIATAGGRATMSFVPSTVATRW